VTTFVQIGNRTSTAYLVNIPIPTLTTLRCISNLTLTNISFARVLRSTFMSGQAFSVNKMAIENREQKSFAELLAEETGRDVSEFELTDDMEFPDPDELEEIDAEEFYSED